MPETELKYWSKSSVCGQVFININVCSFRQQMECAWLTTGLFLNKGLINNDWISSNYSMNSVLDICKYQVDL